MIPAGLKKYVSRSFTLLFISLFVVYFLFNREDFEPLLRLSIWGLSIISLVKVSNQFVNGLFLKWTTEVFVGKVNYFEGVYIATLSAIGNYFGPLLGGASVRAIYLKKVHGLSYSKFASTLFGYYVILFFANNILAILALLLIPDSPLRMSLLLFFLAWMAIVLLIMFVKLPPRQALARAEGIAPIKFIVTVLYDVEHGWREIVTNKTLLLKLAILTVLSSVTSMIAIFAQMELVGVQVTLPGLLLYLTISTASMLISITPAGIGFKESALVLTGSVMGLGTEQVLQIALIDRGLSFVVLGVLYLVTKIVKPLTISQRIDQNL